MRCFSFVSCAFRSEKFKLAAQANASQVCILKFKWHYLLWQNNQCSASPWMYGCCVCVCRGPCVRCASPQHTKCGRRDIRGKKIELFVPYFSEPILSSHRLQCSGDCLCLFWRRPLCTESVSIYSVVLLSFQIAVNIGPVGNCSKISDTDVVKMGRMN